MSRSTKTAGQRARALCKATGKRHISAIMPLISQAVEAAAAKGLFRCDVQLPSAVWFLDPTNQRDLRKALRMEDLDTLVPIVGEDGSVVLPITWGEYPVSGDSAHSAQSPVPLGKATIVVVNGSGNVGRATLVALGAHSDLFQVRATSRKPSRELSEQFPQVQWVYADLDKPESLSAAFAGATKVFYIPSPSAGRPEQAQRVATACKEQGVAHVVDFSLIGAEARSHHFARQLRDSEEHFEAAGIPWTHLRSTWFLDNIYLHSADTIQKANKLFLPLGEGAVSAVAVADVGQVAALLLTRAGADGLVVNLTGPESLTGAQMASILSEELEREVTYVPVPDDKFRESMKGAPEWFVNGMSEMFAMLAQGGGSAVAPDGKRLLKAPTHLRTVVKKNREAF